MSRYQLLSLWWYLLSLTRPSTDHQMVVPVFRASEDSETMDAIFNKDPVELDSMCAAIHWKIVNTVL